MEERGGVEFDRKSGCGLRLSDIGNKWSAGETGPEWDCTIYHYFALLGFGFGLFLSRCNSNRSIVLRFSLRSLEFGDD